MSINHATLIGNVGKDPEIHNFKDGKRKVTFSLATTEQWKDKQTGEMQKKTEWHNIVIFQDGLGRLVEKYVHKGSKLYIQGQIQSRKYKGRDNIERSISEIVLSGFNAELQLLDNKPQTTNNTPDNQNDIPFDN